MIFKNLLKKRQDDRGALVEKFRTLFTERLPEVALTETGPMEFRTDGPGIKGGTIFLENLFRQIEGLESVESDAMIERYFAALTNANTTDDEPVSLGNVVPMIKDQLYLDTSKRNKVDLVLDHFVADLWIVYARDFEDKIKTLKPEHLEPLAIPRESLREVATNNLSRIIPPIEQHKNDDWTLLTAGDYTASVLLFDEVWEQLSEEVNGDLVVAVPTRDVVLVTSATSSLGIAKIKAKASVIEQGGSYAISQTLLRRTEGRWTPFS